MDGDNKQQPQTTAVPPTTPAQPEPQDVEVMEPIRQNPVYTPPTAVSEVAAEPPQPPAAPKVYESQPANYAQTEQAAGEEPVAPEMRVAADQGWQPAEAELMEEPPEDDRVVSWTASESIVRDKSKRWYALLAAGTVSLAVVMYFISHDKVTAVSIVVIGALMAYVGTRKPRNIQYRLDGSGLTLGEKLYPYEKFHSFSLIEEDAFASIAFMPMQRFMPMVTIYFPPENEEQIMELLLDHLPQEEREHDSIDRLLKKIRL